MTTYYVDGAVGDDANAGTSEGAGNAWATIDKAMNTVVAGDIVYVKATGTYSETPSIDTAGSATSLIVFEGYSSTTGDNGKVTVSGTTNCLVGAVNAACYYQFKNFIFSGGSASAVDLFAEDDIAFYNCEFNSSGADGIRIDNNAFFYNCVAHSNTLDGFRPDAGTAFIGCIAYGNGTDQFQATTSVGFYKNVAYGNTTGSAFNTGSTTIFIGNTIDGENTATNGAVMSSTTACIAVDNIIYDCGTGINNSASCGHIRRLVGNNLVNSNTTDYDDTAPTMGLADVTGAPTFTDEAGDDYTLGDGSPAIDAGVQPGGVT